MKAIGELVEQGKRRHAALAKIQKPYKTIAWLISSGLFVYRFFRSSGEFTFSLLGLAVLTFFLLYYATSVTGIKLFARRALALVIDLSLIGVALFVLVSLSQPEIDPPEDILQIQLGEVLILALWVAFLYFVYFDWRFGGTLGKRFLGLRVVAVGETKLSFCSSFIRNFLSLPLPVIGGVFLNYWIISRGQPAPRLFIPAGQFAARLFFGDALKNACVSFVPMSIMFFEGNQSIADWLTRTAIRAEHETMKLLPKIKSKTWALLCFSDLAWALLLASMLYIAVFKVALSGRHKPLPPGADATWTVTDPKTTATLWTVLPTGMKEPTFGIRRIELLEAPHNTFTFQAEKSHFSTPVNPEPYLKATKDIPIVRVILARDRPLQVRLLIVENFVTYVGAQTPMEGRPAFALLQIATEKKFGLFSINEQENLLACWMASRNQAENFYTDVQPHGSIQFPVSLDETGYLLVGAGIPFRPGGVF